MYAVETRMMVFISAMFTIHPLQKKINPRYIHSGMDSNIKWRGRHATDRYRTIKVNNSFTQQRGWEFIHVLELVSMMLIKRSRTQIDTKAVSRV